MGAEYHLLTYYVTLIINLQIKFVFASWELGRCLYIAPWGLAEAICKEF